MSTDRATDSVHTRLLEENKTVQGQSSKVSQEGNLSEYVENVLSSIGFGLFQVIAFVLAELSCIAGVCEAMTFAFVSIQITTHWKMNSLTYASVPAATSIANVIGEVIVGYIADKYGRKWPYVASLFILATFVAVSAFSPSFLVFGVLRNLASIGYGGAGVLRVPMLMEFLPVKYRGVVATSTGLLEGFAKCAVAGLAWWLVPTYQTNGWRYFILVSSIPSFVIAILLMFFVESPRYLVTQNKPEKAWKVFSLIASVNGKKIENILKKEDFLHNIKHLNCNYNEKTKAFVKVAAIFNRQFRRRTICFGFIISIAYSVSYNTTLFLPNYLNAMKLDPYFITLIALVSELPGRALIPIVVEWPEFGRRNTIRIFFFLSVIFYLLFAFVRNEIATPVLIVLVYFSLVPTSGLLSAFISESYPTEIRITALAILSAMSDLTGAWFPFVSGYATDLSYKFPWLSPTYLAGAMFIGFIFTMLLNHETRAQNLEDTVKITK